MFRVRELFCQVQPIRTDLDQHEKKQLDDISEISVTLNVGYVLFGYVFVIFFKSKASNINTHYDLFCNLNL